jgi:hypothetical protein
LQRLLQTADDALPHCLRDAAFYAWRGALQAALGQHAAAVESLERALLLDPDLPGAQLDYAQALMVLGDNASAQGLIEQLQQRPDLPAHLRPLLQQSLQALAPLDATAGASHWLISTALGYDSNLNNAPAASQLTLTFPQGPVTLPLERAYRPQAGAAWLNTAQWQMAKPLGSQAVLFSAEVRARATASTGRTGYLQTDLAAYWLQAPEAPSQWLGRLAWGRLEFGGAHWLSSTRASLQHQWRLAPASSASGGAPRACRLGAGLELENRSYPISPELDGNYSGALASLHCGEAPQDGQAAAAASPDWFSRSQYGLQLRRGQDQARHSLRPGGRYDRTELRVNWEAPLGRARLAADYHWTHQSDSSGYSALFDSNSARRTRRHGARIMLSHPLAAPEWGGAEAFVALEASNQTSNMAAFVVRQHSITTGLRWKLR